MFELTEQEKVNLRLRPRLREMCSVARREAATFAALTVLLTPVALGIFIMVLLFCMRLVDLPIIDHGGYQYSFVTGTNLTLAFMVLSYFLRPKAEQQPADSFWFVLAGGIFCALLLLSYLTTLLASHPVLFWSLYLLMVLLMLGCLGYAYEPKDDYYLGWTWGPVLLDDPFTFCDDIDRAHLGLGFAAAISNLILESYGAVFSSRWLWRGLPESELKATATLLQGLAARDAKGVARHILGMKKESAATIVRALVKLELVVMDKGRPQLSRKGDELVRELGGGAGLSGVWPGHRTYRSVGME